MSRLGGRRGVTLLELLIAVTLLSLLSLGMLFAMGVGFDALTRTNARLMSNRRVLGAQRVLERQISGLIPVLASCGGTLRQLYFFGEPSAMHFVSSYSVEGAARGYASVLSYQVIPGENGRGVRLVSTETPYTGPSAVSGICGGFASLNRAQQGARPFVLADRLAYCRLSYLVPGSVWAPSYGNTTPLAVRIEMAPLEPDPARLQMSSMTVLVRATRDPKREYVDVEPQQMP